MRGWCGAVLLGWLATGCGGMAEDGPTAGTSVEAREDFRSEPADTSRAALTVGTPSRVKAIFPPSQMLPRYMQGPGYPVDFRGRLAFAANFEDGTRSLWVSDGTEAGTFALKTFPPAPPPVFNVQVANLTPAGEQLFFTVDESASGHELWVSDGTATGTRLVKDITPGAASSSPRNLKALGSTLVFFRDVPGTDTTPGRSELWRSDGTSTGTVRVLDLGQGVEVDWRSARAGNALVFFVRDAAGNVAAWRTDGTSAGTQLLHSISGPEGYSPLEVRSSNGLAFFTASGAGGTTVWKSDGTRTGTVRLYTFAADGRYPAMLTAMGAHLYVTLSNPADQRLGLFRLRLDGVGGKEHVATLSNPYASQPDAMPYLNNFSATADRIYFEQAISTSGPAPRDTQLWVTDGTKAGTRLLRRPLSLSDEYGSPITAVDSGLAFFVSYSETSGLEPWVTDGTVEGTRLLKDIAPTGGSVPGAFVRSGARVYFSAFDETQASQLWSVPLSN
jgi:ELWxxDGT repeat protein